VGANDPAAAYDRNPSHIAAQSITWSLPADPAAGAPSCTPGGPIGVLTDGVVLFNALDGEGRDAAAHEVLDSCGGHADMSSTYHHHEVPSRILDQATGRSALVGYAKDGYGIYASAIPMGDLLTNASLDVCHGRTSTVTWNGKKKKLYHYDATLEYPYALGCVHGTPINTP
jgi:YHYH protein